ncbi:hypothetical protein HYR69_05830, partial [Candidatus Sumerlaeota bacterium]|nr:hypothetical protein [Candidatus Sumerlaeota bacterium]
CLVASVIMMFCGASFLHIYAGHLTLIGCAAWAPLILLCVDGFFGVETRKFPWRWVLIGMMAVAMQIYVGHPQYLFNTGVGSALYLAFCLIRAKNRVKPVLAYAAMYGGGMALSAVQLLASAHTGAESTRGAGGFTYQESAFFSLPPENIVTLIAPWFFGKGLGGADAGLAYWGRCYIWEMSLFIGVTGLFLAIYGAVCGERAVRRYSAPMALILLILALGGHTPLLHLLHSLVPGFNRFRGQSKFIFEASVFVSMLSAVGMDRLLRDQEFKKLLPIIAGGAAAGLALFAILISATAGAGGWWSGMPALVLRSAESYYFMRDPNLASNPEFLTKSAGAAAGSLWIASLTCAVLAAALYFLRFDRRAAYAIGALAILEVFLFARTARPMFEIAPALHPEYLQKFHDLNPGDYRILNPAGNDNAMMYMGLQGLWGYDPQVNRRYAEFMYFTQKQNPDKASYSLQFAGINPLYRLLRCKYLFVPGDQGISLRELSDPLPHALLVGETELIQGRDNIFARMSDPSFDPARKVILESAPDPAPVGSSHEGIARVIESETDRLVIEAETEQPAILLITDTYSGGWRARGLEGSAQKEYNVMPADYAIRAIPIRQGKHRIELLYAPAPYIAGKWITVFALLGYFGLAVWRALESRRDGGGGGTQSA